MLLTQGEKTLIMRVAGGRAPVFSVCCANRANRKNPSMRADVQEMQVPGSLLWRQVREQPLRPQLQWPWHLVRQAHKGHD